MADSSTMPIGLDELFLAAVVALILVRPEDWPVIVRRLGRWWGQWRRAWYDWRDHSRRQLADLSRHDPDHSDDP